MRALFLPRRQGLPLAVAVAAALVLSEVARWKSWLGSWAETQQHLGIGFVLVFPIVVGAGAWVGGSSVRSGLVDLTRAAGRPPLAVAAREIGETARWALLGYLVGAVPAYVATAMVAVNDRPGLLPAIAQAACVVGAVSVGYLIGLVVPSPATAPVAGVATYVALGFLSFQAEDALIVLTPIDARSMKFHDLVAWALLTQAVAWMLVSVQAVARRAAHPRTAFGLLAAAGVVMVPALLVTPATRVVNAAALPVTCVEGGDFQLCLAQGDEVLRDPLKRELRLVTRHLAGLLPPRPAFIDDEPAGLSAAAARDVSDAVTESTGAGFVPLLLSDLGGLGDPQLARSEFQYGVVTSLVPLSERETSAEGGTPTDLIQRWYLETVDVPTDGSASPGAIDLESVDLSAHRAEQQWIKGLSSRHRAAWFAAHRDEIERGALTWALFRVGAPE